LRSAVRDARIAVMANHSISPRDFVVGVASAASGTAIAIEPDGAPAL